MIENEITQIILECAFEVHTILGPGLFENTYKECLTYELINNGLHIEKEKSIPVIYKGIRLEYGYRLDLLVEKKVIIELKAVEKFTDMHIAQLLTYLRLSSCRVGLLLNFNEKSLKNGIKRLIL